MNQHRQLNKLDTPCILIDLDRVKRNITRFQDYCNQHGLKNRPHIKTHKQPKLAQWQLEAGAIGITCQKISEAEVFADAGCDDIFITYNIIGEHKVARLKRLADRVKVAVVADSDTTILGLAQQFVDENQPLSVFVECDTGAGRCGVQNAAEVVTLAQLIQAQKGLTFTGLMTYPRAHHSAATQTWLQEAVQACEEAGIQVAQISSGGTPDLWSAHKVNIATEYRAGTYIYNDRSLLDAGLCTIDDCALYLIATVVSLPTPDRAIIDAGTKSLTADLLGLKGHGYVCEYPEAHLRSLSEEHGIIDLTNCSQRPIVGEKISIIPNHVCPVSNLYNEAWCLVDGVLQSEPLAIPARGCVY